MTLTLLRENVHQPILDDDVEIVVTELEASPEEVDEARRLLSEDECLRADRFVFDRDRARYTLARAQLRRLLGKKLETRAELVEFTYGPHGKPALADRFEYSDVRFNISHSENVAIAAICVGREIGIDIEAIHDMSDRDELAAHCFSKREYRMYQSLTEDQKTNAFYECWTRKEAFVKALGDGLQCPLNNFDVTLRPGDPADFLRIGDCAVRDRGWELHSFTPRPGFVGAMAIQGST